MHHAEPHRIKVVETIHPIPSHVLSSALKDAGYNVHRIPRNKVYLDLVSVRSPCAMSDRQWSGLMMGDEAYAGSENFYALEAATAQVFGKNWLVPAHGGRGCENLLIRHLLKPGQVVIANGCPETLKPLLEANQGRLFDAGTTAALNARKETPYKGNFDLETLSALLADHEGQVAFVAATAAVPMLGGQVIAPENLEAASSMCRKAGVPLVLNVSALASAAYFYKETAEVSAPMADIMRRYASAAVAVYMTAREDACCNTGGLIAGDDEDLLLGLRSWVVVFEGLHTYGGQAGRDMQAFAHGLLEMQDEAYPRFRRRKLDYLVRHLRELGFEPYYPAGTDGVALDARAMLEGPASSDSHCAAALAAALYLDSGVRAAALGPMFQGCRDQDLLVLRIPRRAYTEAQLGYVLKAMGRLKDFKGLRPFRLIATGEPAEMATFEPQSELTLPVHENPVQPPRLRPEPFIVTVVEPLSSTTRDQREEAIKEAGYNTFLLPSRDVYIDLLTDSGTSAMSARQWAGVVPASESESGTQAFDYFEKAIQEVLGFRYVLPTHQGRAAEHLLSQTCIKPGQIVINNMYFTTTREHQEMAGGVFVDCILDLSYDSENKHPFKGDIDPDKLEQVIKEHGADAIAYVCLETNVNMAGGQPVSMANTRRISHICRYHEIPLYFDATRVAENAYFIKWKEPGYADRSIREILLELMSYGDGCTISAKKDLLVNIGGVLATNDEKVYRKVARLGCIYEGGPRTGGLACRDLMAMAVGAYEMTDVDYLRNRVEQVQFLGRILLQNKIPIVEPPGGHAIFLDAGRFLDHLPQNQFPAQRLAAELYVESGVRAMERGIVSAGRNRKTGDHNYPKLELVRLAIPRRVYTYSHMEIVADAVLAVWERRHEIPGLDMTYEPPTLRFFQARFETHNPAGRQEGRALSGLAFRGSG